MTLLDWYALSDFRGSGQAYEAWLGLLDPCLAFPPDCAFGQEGATCECCREALLLPKQEPATKRRYATMAPEVRPFPGKRCGDRVIIGRRPPCAIIGEC